MHVRQRAPLEVTQNSHHWLLNIWVKVNWINEMHIAEMQGQISDCPANGLKAMAEIFSAMTRDKDQSGGILIHQFMRQSRDCERGDPFYSAPRQEESIDNRISCYNDILRGYPLLDKIGPAEICRGKMQFSDMTRQNSIAFFWPR